MPNWLKLTLKIVVSGGLIYLLLSNVDFAKVIGHLESYSTLTIGLAFFLLLIQFPISVVKWNHSLLIHKLNYPFIYLQKVLCIGFFFNNFLPTSIGGDAYRALKTMPKDGYKSTAVSAILLERIAGFAVLIGLGFIGAFFIMVSEGNELAKAYVILCTIGGVCFLIGLFLLFKVKLFHKYLNKLRDIKKLEMLFHNYGLIKNSSNIIIKMLMVSIVFQLIAILAVSVLFNKDITIELYAQCALLASVVGIAGLLPISINGIGVIEGAFAMAAVQLGMDFDQAIVIAFVQRVLVIPISLMCGVVYMLNTDKDKSTVM